MGPGVCSFHRRSLIPSSALASFLFLGGGGSINEVDSNNNWATTRPKVCLLLMRSLAPSFVFCVALILIVYRDFGKVLLMGRQTCHLKFSHWAVGNGHATLLPMCDRRPVPLTSDAYCHLNGCEVSGRRRGLSIAH